MSLSILKEKDHTFDAFLPYFKLNSLIRYKLNKYDMYV